MKLVKCLLFSAAALSFAACSNDDDVMGGNEIDNRPVAISVDLSDIVPATRQGGAPGESASKETTSSVSNLSLALVTADGTINKFTELEFMEIPVGQNNAGQMGYKCDKGDKNHYHTLTEGYKFIDVDPVMKSGKVVAVANWKQTLNDGVGAKDFDGASLDNNESFGAAGHLFAMGEKLNNRKWTVARKTQQDGFATSFMRGEANVENTGNIEPGEIDPETGSGAVIYKADVKLKPIFARVQIKGINVVTNSTDAQPAAEEGAEWNNFTCDVTGIVLNSFHGKARLTGVEMPTSTTEFDLLGAKSYLGDVLTNTKWMPYFWSMIGNNNAMDTEQKFDGDKALWVSADTQEEGSRAAMELPSANKCYPFALLPQNGAKGACPTLHLRIDNIQVEGDKYKDLVTSSQEGTPYFINVVSYQAEKGGDLQSFEGGMIYNISLDVRPDKLGEDFFPGESINVVAKVTVEPWNETTITPGYDK